MLLFKEIFFFYHKVPLNSKIGLKYFVLTINILKLFSKEGIFNINANCILYLTIDIEFMPILNLNLQVSVCDFFFFFVIFSWHGSKKGIKSSGH